MNGKWSRSIFGVAALLAALAIIAASAAAAGAPVKGATYKGSTVNTPGANPVSFKVAKNGKHVLNFTTTLGYDGKCGQGGGPSFKVHLSSTPLSRKGTFKAFTNGTLGPLKARIEVTGHIKGRKASGVVEEPAAFHCTSGPNVGANAYTETYTATAK